MVNHDYLQHKPAYAFRWVLNGETELGTPEIFYDPKKLVDYIAEILGDSEVNDEIFDWSLGAKIGDVWSEDDLIIIRI